jgi:hypothetical protein
MGWQDYATYDPISPVNQAFPSAFAQGRDVPVNQMPSGMAFGTDSGGFGGLGQFAPLLAGKFGSMLMSNANTAQSAQNAMGTSIGMFDVNQGIAAADRRRATFEDMMAPIRASRIKMNPEYRRGQVRDTLLSSPGRYSALMA